MKQHMLTHKIRDMPAHLFETNKPTMPPPVPGINVPNEDSTSTEDRSMPTPTSLEPAPKPDLGVKRSPPEGETVLPIPKRQPGKKLFVTLKLCMTIYYKLHLAVSFNCLLFAI